jgi:D-ribulokinase
LDSTYCGIDVGTQGVRAAVVSADGRLLGAGSASLPESVRLDGRHEQHPDSWWTALVSAVRAAVDAAGDVHIDGLALDATSGTVLVEHADGTPAGPALMYDDARAADQAERAQAVGAQLWSALGYRMQRSWALPKVMWLVEAGALGTGDRVVHQSDHLVRRLAGEPVPTDTSHALKTGADLRDASWPMALFGDLGVSADRLPDLVWPGTRIGAVGTAAAEATGLRAGTPITAGMTDGCAAQIAAGALRVGSWSSALGTTLVIKGATEALIHDPSGAVYSHRHPDGGWLPGGASNTGAGVIAREFAGADLAALTVEAAQLIPVDGVTYPLSGRGERFPFIAADAAGFTSGGWTTPAQRFAALCVGIAYVERLAYDVLGGLGADVNGPVALTGGATRNEWWNQLRTDVLGRPTQVPQFADPAVGMAVLAAAAPGELTVTAERMTRIGARYQPDPERGQRLRPGYRALVGALVERGWLTADVVAHEVAQ